MREQKAQLSIPRRASAPVEEQGQRHYTTRIASPHRAGHYAGLHPEDQPYYTTETRTRRSPQADTEDDEIYEQRSRSSAVRYRPLYEEERQEGGVSPYQQEKKGRNWLVFVGVALLVMLVGWVLISLLGIFVQRKMDDWTYGNPRTY